MLRGRILIIFVETGNLHPELQPDTEQDLKQMNDPDTDKYTDTDIYICNEKVSFRMKRILDMPDIRIIPLAGYRTFGFKRIN